MLKNRLKRTSEMRAGLSAVALCLIGLQLPQTAAAADTPCQMVKVTDLDVTVTPYNKILIAGSINGKDTQYVVDTGSFATLFDSSVVSRFGAVPFNDHIRSYGVGGQANDSTRANIPNVMLGKYSAGSGPFIVSGTHFLSDAAAALLGEDLLDMFDLDIDLAHNKIGLFQYNRCAAEPVYWAQSFSEADISVRNHKIMVSLELNGTPFRATFDTGASRTLISTAFARRLGFSESSAGMVKSGTTTGVDQHRIDVYQYRFSELHVGDEVIKNPLLNVANLVPVKKDFHSAQRIQESNLEDSDGILGADFIKTHHIYVATRSGKMYFTYNGGGIFSPPRDDSSAAAAK